LCPQFSTSRHVLQASDSSWWSNKADGSQQASLKGLHELLRLAAHGPTVRFVKRRTCIPNRTTFEVEVQGYLEPYFECLGGSSGSFLSRLTSPLLVYLQPLENQTIPSLSYTKMLGDQDTCEGAIHISPTAPKTRLCSPLPIACPCSSLGTAMAVSIGHRATLSTSHSARYGFCRMHLPARRYDTSSTAPKGSINTSCCRYE
jgi:hypothetical protein